jgi:uncharacterized membrane protein
MAKKSLILILSLALMLRLINLGQSLWLDEAAQAEMSTKSVSYIWDGRGGDFHPPLYYFISHFWLQLGKSEIWLRLPSVIFSVLTVYVVYLLAKKISSGKILIRKLTFEFSLLAAFFTAINPFLIYYSQEFRSYSLLGLLGTLAMYFLFTRSYWKLSLINTLLFYTHYSSVFLFLAQIVFVFFYRRSDLRRFLAGVLVSAVLYLPWFPHLLQQLRSGVNIDIYLPGWRNVLSISPLKAFPVILFKLIAGRISFISRYLYGVYIIFVFAGAFFAFVYAKVQKNFLSVWLLVPVLSMILTSLAVPQSQPFRVIYLTPALCLLFASAALRFPKLILAFVIYVALVGNIAYYTRPRLQREQWRQAASFLTSVQAPVIVKFPASFAPLVWYAPSLPIVPAVSDFPARPEQVATNLSSLQGYPGSIYLMEYLTGLTDPNREVDQNLKDLGFTPSGTYNFEGVGFIYKYSKI